VLLSLSHRARFGVTLALLCVFALSLGLTSAQDSPVQTQTHTETGLVTFVGTQAGQPLYVAGVNGANGPAVNADLILQRLAPQFGVRDVAQELTFARDFVTMDGRTTRRYQQMYRGVPVFGGALVMNTRADGGLLTMAGEISPDLNIDTTPKLTPKRVRQIAKGLIVRESGMAAKALVTTQPELVIYDERLLMPSQQPARLAYKVVVTDRNATKLSYTLLIDAKNGRTLLSYANFDSDHSHFAEASGAAAGMSAPEALPLPPAPDGATSIVGTDVSADLGAGVPRLGGAPKISTYTANKTTNLPGSLLCNQSKTVCTGGTNRDADSAHRFARDTYNYYWSMFGRDSINGMGMTIISTTDYENGSTCNAFWNGTQMVYFDRCSLGTVVLDDVVAHELTHGVTEHTASLIYYGQSGAINESLSDVFGEFVDQANGTGEDSIAFNRWKIGEPHFYMRNMQDPHLKSQPKAVNDTFWYTGMDDNGGVHTNSGVGNYMAYLMANDMGNERAARIWYEALTNILFPGANYRDLGNALVQACNNLVNEHDITSLHCTSISTYTGAVYTNMIAPTANAGSPLEASTSCPAGLSAGTFYETFEANKGQWVFGADLGKKAWRISDQAPLSGNRSLQGRDWPSKSVSWAAMKNNVAILPNSYLYFIHDYRFEEWNGTAYDGGYVEYTINNGATWQKLTAGMTGQLYNATVNPANPRAATRNPMFGFYTLNGTSGTSVSSTRFDLSALAGKNARFRWVIATDTVGGAAGWWVDNVYIYNCIGSVVHFNTLVNSNFESGTTGWTLTGVSGGDQVTCAEGGDLGSCMMRFIGVPGEATTLRQNVDVGTYPVPAGATILFSGSYQSNNAGKVFDATITVTYSDGTKTIKTVPFYNSGPSWVGFIVKVKTANKPITGVKVSVKHTATSGTTYMDYLIAGAYNTDPMSFAGGGGSPSLLGGALPNGSPLTPEMPSTPGTSDGSGTIPLPPPPPVDNE